MHTKGAWSLAVAVMIFGLLLTVSNNLWSWEERLMVFMFLVLLPPAVIFFADWFIKDNEKNSYRRRLFKEFKESEKS